MKFVKVLISLEVDDCVVEARHTNDQGVEDWSITKAELEGVSLSTFLNDWNIIETAMTCTVTPIFEDEDGNMVVNHMEEVTLI